MCSPPKKSITCCHRLTTLHVIGITSDSNFAGIEFRPAQRDDNVIVGLGPLHPEPRFSTVGFGIFLASSGQLFVYENGQFRSSLGNYQFNSSVQIRVNREGVMEYVLNGNVRFRSDVAPVYPIFVDIVLFSENAAVSYFRFLTKQEIYCDKV